MFKRRKNKCKVWTKQRLDRLRVLYYNTYGSNGEDLLAVIDEIKSVEAEHGEDQESPTTLKRRIDSLSRRVDKQNEIIQKLQPLVELMRN